MVKKLNIWLLAYGLCSIAAGFGFVFLATKLAGGPRWVLGVLGCYMLISGIAIGLHHRCSPELFLGSGVALLGWSLVSLLNDGYGRTQLFGVLGSLITVHGYWVLKQEIERS